MKPPLSKLILNLSPIVIFLVVFAIMCAYFYNTHQNEVKQDRILQLEQEKHLLMEKEIAEKSKAEAQLKYILEQKRLEQELLSKKQAEQEIIDQKKSEVDKQKSLKEEQEKLKLEELERVQKEKELQIKLLAEQNRKTYLNNVSSTAFEILESLKGAFPSDGRIDRNTYDKISPFLVVHTTFVASLKADQESFALDSVVELVNFVQINQNVINEAKKKNDSWDAYVASLNSPERKKQEEESKKRGKEMAAKASAELERKLQERKAARDRQMSIWAGAGGGRAVIADERK